MAVGLACERVWCGGGGIAKSPQRMMSNSVPESEKEILTGCVSFYTQWFDVCVCIRVRGLHLVFLHSQRTEYPSQHTRGIIFLGESVSPEEEKRSGFTLQKPKHLDQPRAK